MPHGLLRGLGSGNSETTPAGVILPIAFGALPFSTNHRLPSGPVTISRGRLSGVGMENAVTIPDVVIRTILFDPVPPWVNQRFPSGPAVMYSAPPNPANGNSVCSPDVVIRPILGTDS